MDVLKQAHPSCRIALFEDYIDVHKVMSVFSAGADGYLLRDIAPRALKASLDMIMAGERVCPADVLGRVNVRGHVVEAVPDGLFAGHNLSTREVQVLGFLAEGNSNKEIARSLDITEAKEKVHIKAVLRKLDLSNRPQAAVWPVNMGITDTDRIDSLGAKAA